MQALRKEAFDAELSAVLHGPASQATDIDLMEHACERPQGRRAAVERLLTGLQTRHCGDPRTSAALAALRWFFLPDAVFCDDAKLTKLPNTHAAWTLFE